MVRRRFHPIIAFAAVIAAAGSVTAAGLTFTAHTVSKTVAELPTVKARTLPSYVLRLPETRAADLDISKSIEVKPAVKAPMSPPTLAVETPPTLVAEVSPLPEEPPPGDLYVVRSDVFVRSGPSKRYGQIGTATRGTRLTVDDEDGGWLKVSFEGNSGWIYQRYLTPAGSGEVAEAETGTAPF